PFDLENLLTDMRTRLDPELPPQERTHALLQAVLTIGEDLDLPTVLRRLTEVAAALTGARYAGLGVFDEDDNFSEYVSTGLSQTEQITGFPHCKAVLNTPLRRRSVLRLRDLHEHPDFGGFPNGHPQMSSFLGAPIQVRGEVFGNLYLADKESAEEFDKDDEEMVTALATAAGAAMENARVYESGESTSIPALRQANCVMLTHRGYGPGLLVPLGTPGNTRGVLLLGKLSDRAPFTPMIRRMLHGFSVQAGVALELAEARKDT